MANTPFKFRYVNEIVGTFVILVVALLVAGMVLVGRAQKWFAPQRELHVAFPAEGTLGLQKGSEIFILGARAGLVHEITVGDDGRMLGLLRIDHEYGRFIRTDTTAVVKKKFGVAGDAYIDIMTGTGEPLPLDPAPVLPIKKDTELLEIVQMVVEQVQSAVLPALEEMQNTLAEYRGLAEDLRKPEGNLQQALAKLGATIEEVQKTVAGLNRGEGTAGKVLRDTALHDETRKILEQVNQLLAQVRDTMKRVDAIADDIKRTTAPLPDVAGTVQGEMKDVPGLVRQTQGTLREAEMTLDAAQRHWLLRRYATRERPLDAIPVNAVGQPEGGGK